MRRRNTSLSVDVVTSLLSEVGFMRSCIASGEKLSQTDLDRQNAVMARAVEYAAMQKRVVEAMDTLLALVPDPDDYWYIEDRFGEMNHRGEGLRFVIDRRPIEKAAGRTLYENDAANERVRKIVDAVHAVRELLGWDLLVANSS